MGFKEKAAEKVLGSMTGKALKGAIPLLESLHARLELSNENETKIIKLLESIYSQLIGMRLESNQTTEHLDENL